MTKIYFNDGTSEIISDDLLKCVIEFGTVLREKLGDDSERVFKEICSDIFDLAMSKAQYELDSCNDIDDLDRNIDNIENPF